MSVEPEPAGVPSTFRAAIRSRSLRRLLLALLTGSAGQQVLTLAVGVWVLERTGSGLWVSVAVALTYLPYALLSGVAGVVVDRHSRSRVLAMSSAVRAACTLAVLAAVGLDGPPWAVVAIAAVAAVAATPGYPAAAAATVECVPSSSLPAANALVTGVENVAWTAGPGVFGLLLLTGHGPPLALAVAAALFGIGTVSASRVGLRRPARPVGTGDDDRLRAVLWLAGTDPRVRLPLLIALLNNLLYGFLVVALVLLTATADERLGALNVALTVGALVGMLVVNRLARRRPTAVMVLLLAVFGLAVGLLGAVGTGSTGLALVGLAAAASVVAEVVAVTVLQRVVPATAHGRVLGLYDQVAVGAIGLGSLVAGPAADAFAPGPATGLAGGLTVVVVAVAVLVARLRGRPRSGVLMHGRAGACQSS